MRVRGCEGRNANGDEHHTKLTPTHAAAFFTAAFLTSIKHAMKVLNASGSADRCALKMVDILALSTQNVRWASDIAATKPAGYITLDGPFTTAFFSHRGSNCSL